MNRLSSNMNEVHHDHYDAGEDGLLSISSSFCMNTTGFQFCSFSLFLDAI